jgi:hypothetical protein
MGLTFNRIHLVDADGSYLGLPTGLPGRSFSPFERPMMVLEHAVVNRVSRRRWTEEWMNE